MSSSASYTAVDLDKLPAPDIVEALDFEAILAELLADYTAKYPQFTAQLESEPVVKLLEVFAYRELLLRSRINQAARSVMPAFAKGSDLDHLGARYHVARLQVTAADNSAVPPVPAVMESDAEYLRRILLSLEKLSAAGARGAYIYHALTLRSDLSDANATRPNDGEVLVSLLAREGAGIASAEAVTAVNDFLNNPDNRQLCATVSVASASIVDYTVSASIVIADGWDAQQVLAASRASIAQYVGEMKKIGLSVPLSGFYSALHVSGVRSVNLVAPGAAISVNDASAANCSAVSVSLA